MFECSANIANMLDQFGAHLVAFLLCINDEPEYFNEDIPQLLAGSLTHDGRKRKNNSLDADRHVRILHIDMTCS